MILCYIVEYGDVESVDEMLALELNDHEEALLWIFDSLSADSAYYNANIRILKVNHLIYNDYGSKTNFYAKDLFLIKANDDIGIDVREDECSDIIEIIESSLNVISKIKYSGILEER